MLARFEKLMEQAVEGSLRRVFPTTLQPVQIAKVAARSMEQARVVGLRGSDVPNSYQVWLAPPDYERFADYRSTLSRELSQYLVEYAHERGLRPVAEPHVELLEDARVRPGMVRVDARFRDLSPAQQSELESAVAGTRQLRLADLANAQRAANHDSVDQSLVLADALGTRFVLEPTLELVRVGRALDNDLAIADQRVSRYHVQLRRVEGTWLVYDLESTNGSFVDDRRVVAAKPIVLAAGNTLRLADHDLTVRLLDGA
jgi:hypothetical protein